MILRMIWGVSLLCFSVTTQAARIKDVSSVAGVRDNGLVGYGLVVGLPGSGESTPFTDKSFAAMLNNFGIQLPTGTKPKTKNVAAVAVSAKLPAFAQSMLETSNVNVTEELVNMIEAQRVYEMNSKVISSVDQMLSYVNQQL